MKSRLTKYTTVVFGLVLVAVGLNLIKTSGDQQGMKRELPNV